MKPRHAPEDRGAVLLSPAEAAAVLDALLQAGFAEIEALCARPARHSPERMRSIAGALHVLGGLATEAAP